jgi:hypothetical protein
MSNLFSRSEDDASEFIENIFKLGNAGMSFMMANPISWAVVALFMLKGKSIKLGKNSIKL